MRAVMFPGQGAQSRGMGADLFRRYPEMARKASEVVGWDVEELCVRDPHGRLGLTQYTQPALYVANALAWLAASEKEAAPPTFFLGHSLGEYNALLAAGAFDFETGLKLVMKRGELMAATSDGKMLAVVGLSADAIRRVMLESGISALDIANYNTDDQIVVAGPATDIERARAAFTERTISTIPLNVSAPFHSRYMRVAAEEFAAFLQAFSFSTPTIQVIANFNARPYAGTEVARNLARQITGSVLWRDSISYLLQQDPQISFTEIGSTILTKMVTRIRSVPTPAPHMMTPRSSPKTKLFCVAYAGGDSRAYAGLAGALRSAEVVALELPGRGRRTAEPLLTDLVGMANDLRDQLTPQIDGPYALYGHSLGARLAYLLARRLQDGTQPSPTHLFVSGEAGPTTESKESKTWTLPHKEFWEHLSRMGGCPPELFEHADLMSHYEPILRADFRALSGSTPSHSGPLAIPITVAIGDDEAVSIADARQWQGVTVHPLTLRMYAGGHFFIRQHWPEIADLMERRLVAAGAPH